MEEAADEQTLVFIELLGLIERVGESIGKTLDKLKAGLVTIDEESYILFANETLAQLFGYERHEDLHGKSLTVLMPERLRETHLRSIKRYLRTGERHLEWAGVDLPALHADGHEFTVRITFTEFRQNGSRRFAGLVQCPPE